jgi:hypothetical protein
MNKAFRAFCVISLTMAVPSIVVAQSNTAFDGTYAGISTIATGGGSGCKPFEPIPRPLTIREGKGQFKGGSYVTGDVVFEASSLPKAI